MTVSAVHLTIHGRVQGVGYRSWLLRNAQKAGLTGWVRNRADGTVEALLCGEETAVDALIAECHRGPLAAQVKRIERGVAGMVPPTDFRQLSSV